MSRDCRSAADSESRPRPESCSRILAYARPDQEQLVDDPESMSPANHSVHRGGGVRQGTVVLGMRVVGLGRSASSQP